MASRKPRVADDADANGVGVAGGDDDVRRTKVRIPATDVGNPPRRQVAEVTVQ
jgi:hypothetical protein